MITVEAINTKERLRMFRTSLLAALDKERLDEMDMWVYLAAKVAQLVLLALAFLALLPELKFGITFLTSIAGLFIVLIFEVFYRYASIRRAFDFKILLVYFSIYGLWFGSSYGFLLVLGLIAREYVLVSVIWVIAILLSVRILSSKVLRWTEERIRSAIVDSMKRFESVITMTASRYYFKARMSASIIAANVVMAYFLAWQAPSQVDWWPIVVLALLVTTIWVIIDLARIDKFVESLDVLWNISNLGVTDLMTYCLLLSERLPELGITHYRVVYRHKPCRVMSDLPDVNPSDLIHTSLYFLGSEKPVILLMPVGSEADESKMMTYLNERWTKCLIAGAGEEGLLAICPPLFFPDARLLIDRALTRKDRIAWVSGKPCFGLELSGSDLAKISSHVGDFSA